MNTLFRKTFMLMTNAATRFQFASTNVTNDKLLSFTEIHIKKQQQELNKQVSKGRGWWASELRLKSTEDLQKLWYVFLKEKNLIFSDNEVKKRYLGGIGRQGRLGHIKRSMARLLTVVSERKKVRDNYRKQLEEEYIEGKRQEYTKLLEVQSQSIENLVPKITPNLLLAKWRALKHGIDNIGYIEECVQINQKRQETKALLEQKYDYSRVKSVNTNKESIENKEVTVPSSQKVFKKFKSMLQKQIELSIKISQEEILRSHVRNWKMLTIKQKRIILGLINAHRAREAKAEFLTELSLVGQYIAHDQKHQKSIA